VEAKLIIFGEGDQRSELQSLINSKNLQHEVLLYGFAKNPYKFLRKANLFVLSSNFEGFGNVLVEAMACGTPVISTNCPSGPNEILEKGKYGTITEVGNSEELAKGIVQELKFNKKLDDAIEHLEKFKSDIVSNNYLKLLNRQ
jgi:glycosyltransferase involved in cell wall biosynthesis